jgi:hypothetical protein
MFNTFSTSVAKDYITYNNYYILLRLYDMFNKNSPPNDKLSQKNMTKHEKTIEESLIYHLSFPWRNDAKSFCLI